MVGWLCASPTPAPLSQGNFAKIYTETFILHQIRQRIFSEIEVEIRINSCRLQHYCSSPVVTASGHND
jgi:hypothetical protein